MIGKRKPLKACNPDVCNLTRDNQIDKNTELGAIVGAHAMEASRQMNSLQKRQLEIARALGVDPASLLHDQEPAVYQSEHNNGTPSAQFELILLQDCLALVRNFNRIRDPEIRHRLLRLVEDTATREQG